MLSKLTKKNFLAVSVSTLLAACGGSGGGNSTNVEIKPAKAQLGALADANIDIYEIGSKQPYKHLFTEKTSTGKTVVTTGNFNSHSESLIADKFYLYKVSKGMDIDANDDGVVDKKAIENKGEFHAIIKGTYAKSVGGHFKITAASEIQYRKVKSKINDKPALEKALDDSAKEIIKTDVDGDATISSNDVLQYDPVNDKKDLTEDYQDTVPQVIKETHTGESTATAVEKQAPTANAGGDKSLVLGTSVDLSGSGLDADGTIVSYEWAEESTLLSNEKKFSYTSAKLGVHTLTLTVKDNDGLESSDRVNITIVEKSNTTPTAEDLTYEVDEDTQVIITLNGKDKDGDKLTYKIISSPVNGVLSGKAPNLIYKPAANYNGEDRIIYVSNDGKADSERATVKIKVTPTNDKPVLIFDGDGITTKEDTAHKFTLAAQDQENDAITYNIVQKPNNGVLTHQKNNFVYTPKANFVGNDQFSVEVNDGNKSSDEKRIAVDVTAVNDAPTVEAGDTKSVLVGASIKLTAEGQDVDGDTLAYSWFENNKELAKTKTLTYQQSKAGAYTLTVTVKDTSGATGSDRVVVRVNEAPNSVPSASNQSIQMNEDTVKQIILKASDSDNDTLTYKIIDKPKHGAIKGTVPNVSYTPVKDYFGNDVFTFRASDGKDDSNTAKISIKINDVVEPDTVKPVITLKGAATITVVQGETYTELGATARDARDGVVAIETTGLVNTTKVGTYTITYTTTDAAGNKASKTRTIKVVLAADTIKPVITLKGATTITVVQNAAYTELGATAKDTRDGVVAVKTTGTVTTTKVGTYTITYSATDKAGNKATKARTVKVVLSADTIKPVITLKGASNITVVEGETYTELGATALDARDGVVTVKTTGSVNTIKVGSYTVRYTATDVAGNKATKTRAVTVVLPADTTKPVITLTGAVTVSVVQNTTYTDAGATALDARDGTITVQTTGSVNTTKVGSYTITYTATDVAGNKATKSRTVKVLQAPIIEGKLSFYGKIEFTYHDAPSAGYWIALFAENKKDTQEYIAKTGTLTKALDTNQEILVTSGIARTMATKLVFKIFEKDSWKVLATSQPFEGLPQPTLTASSRRKEVVAYPKKAPFSGYWIGFFSKEKQNTHEYLARTKTLKLSNGQHLSLNLSDDTQIVAKMFAKDSWELLATSEEFTYFGVPDIKVEGPGIVRIEGGNYVLHLQVGDTYRASNIKSNAVVNGQNVKVTNPFFNQTNVRTDRVWVYTNKYNAYKPDLTKYNSAEKILTVIVENNPLSSIIKQKLGQDAYPANFFKVGSKTYFTVNANLYITDGTLAGTRFIRNFGSILFTSFVGLTEVDGSLYFNVYWSLYNVKYNNSFLYKVTGTTVTIIDQMSTRYHSHKSEQIELIRDESGKLLYKILGRYYLHDPRTGKKTLFTGSV